MARRIIERRFDPTQPVVVRRPFTGSGRHYSPGDSFPWRQLAVSERRARLLFEAGKLRHPEEGSAPPPPKDAAATPSYSEEYEDGKLAEEEVSDDLDDLSMMELRDIAKDEGAPLSSSKVGQRKNIRDNRKTS